MKRLIAVLALAGSLSVLPSVPVGVVESAPDADAHNSVTTPTPPILPLTLQVGNEELATYYALCPGNHNKLPFHATTSNDSTVVARGDVKKTKKQLAADEQTTMKAKLKHPNRLREKRGHNIEVKVKVKATDEFGQTATKAFTPRLRNPGGRTGGCPQ